MFLLNSNEPVKIVHVHKLANQSVLNGALVIDSINNPFRKSKKNSGRLIERGTSKLRFR